MGNGVYERQESSGKSTAATIATVIIAAAIAGIQIIVVKTEAEQ